MEKIFKNIQIDKNKNRGFSLVELMVAVALIAVLTSIIITTARFSETQKNLTLATDAVQSTIRLAQSYSLSIPNEGDDNICGFGFYVKTDKSYAVYYTYDNDPTDSSTCDDFVDPAVSIRTELETGSFSDDEKVKFDSSAVGEYAFFSSPYGDVKKSNSFKLISTGNSGGEKTINVSLQGKID